MRDTVKLLVALCCGIIFSHLNSRAYCAPGSQYVDLYDSVSFADGDVFNAAGINVNSSLFMENDGVVNSDIFVCPACDFYVRNSGEITGLIHLTGGASMTQIVLNAEDLTMLDADAPYTVVADGAHGLAWDDLVAVAGNAGTLVIRDSEVLVAPDGVSAARFAWRAPVIELQGGVTVRLDDAYEYSGRPVLRNVTGDGTVVIAGWTPSGLYAVSSQMRGSDLYLNLVRETDYYKILGNDLGRGLNALRSAVPDDSLLRKLDAAHDVGELHHIMSRSVAIKPFLMAAPMRMLNNFMKNDGMGRGAGGAAGVYGGPFYLSSSDFSAYGAALGMGVVPAENMTARLGLYGAMLDCNDDINNYDAEMYGANVMLGYVWDGLFLRAIAGATYASFDVPYVMRPDFKQGPVHGVSLYGESDFGVRFEPCDFLTLAPYVGVEYDYAKLGPDNDFVINGRTGLDVVLGYEGVDLRYEYKTGVAINDAGNISAMVGVGMWSASDDAGADAGVHVARYDGVVSYMFKISAGIGF